MDKKIDVGHVAHPSFVEADKLRGINAPLSISAAGQRSRFVTFPSPPKEFVECEK